jgi:hypothetical protein
MSLITEMRSAEVEVLRRHNRELTSSLEEMMQPQGAMDVIEAWICADLAPSKEKLKLLDALREVCEMEGWE